MAQVACASRADAGKSFVLRSFQVMGHWLGGALEQLRASTTSIDYAHGHRRSAVHQHVRGGASWRPTGGARARIVHHRGRGRSRI